MTNIERYDYAFDPDGEEWAARLLRRVPSGGGSVLELGPGPGAMTRVLLARGHRVTVVENDPEALEVLKTLDVEIISGNLDGADWLDAVKGRQFDTVMACDVLEHLRKPEDVLQRLSEFVAPMGCLLISVPNIAYAGVLASMRSGIFDYSDKGQLDRTHVRFFTKRSIEKVLLDCGWAPRVWEANRVPVECSEFAGYWSALSGDQRQALLAGWQDFDVYQWMVVVTPSVATPTWELKEARGMADSLRGELQALTVLHQRERASLLEHQKAFAEAKDIISKLQQDITKLQEEINELRTDVGSLRSEKAAVESELAKTRIELQARTVELTDRAWRSRWRRLMGSHYSH
ncbi:class I SAM-dependent methyltransferase [Acidovorax radicis]|uniref:class I SAM-dependent methyltransferase n=1 Tax=Acidovorax radicis TaxID=758826 RepID=UPI0002375F80|nr:class I SAM-dependent methyltransferase [Acidovorax radicis]